MTRVKKPRLAAGLCVPRTRGDEPEYKLDAGLHDIARAAREVNVTKAVLWLPALKPDLEALVA